MSPAGVIFDLDGTILETEKLARRCFLEACADVGHADIDITVYDACVGTTHEATEQIMRAGFGPKFPFEKMSARWSEIYAMHITRRPVPRRPGIEMLLSRLHEMDIPMAIATSSRRPTVETKLDKARLALYFRFYICGGEAEVGKPHPAPYLKAVETLDLRAQDCWAIEDSDNGVRAAHAAGLEVFQIPDELAPSKQIRELGHEILPSALDLLDRLQ